MIALCLTASACTREAEAPSTEHHIPPADATPASQASPTSPEGISIEFSSTPDPPEAGDNTFEATVKGPDGAPVTDATVTAVLSMPAMPSMNMPAMRSEAALTHAGDGRYRGAGQLSMSGTWNVSVAVARSGQQIAAKKLSIVAK